MNINFNINGVMVDASFPDDMNINTHLILEHLIELEKIASQLGNTTKFYMKKDNNQTIDDVNVEENENLPEEDNNINSKRHSS